MAEGIDGATAGSSGQSNSALDIGADIAAESIVPTEREKAVFRSLMLDTFLTIPDPTVEWLSDRIARNGIPVSISQIQGFAQSQAQTADNILTQESTASTSYANLATTGPELTGLPDGQYIVFFGANMFSTTAEPSMSIQVNSTAASDDDRVVTGAGTAAHQSRACTKTLNADGNNTITVKYKSNTGGSCTFFNRWLFALKFANA